MKNYNKYFRVSVTNKCNLGCYFCHNEGNSKEDKVLLSAEDIEFICKLAVTQGFSKIKLTGGEPTLREDIGDIIKRLTLLGINDVSLISNGTLLSKKIVDIKGSGLRRLNITLNTLNPEMYEKITKRSRRELYNTIKGIDIALSKGYNNIKINFVYMGNESETDLNEMINFVNERGLILVVLPVIERNCSKTSLRSLYDYFKSIGINGEHDCTDSYGIKKTMITLNNGAKILLRLEELVEHMPYKFCTSCEVKNNCREGIFPLRLSSDGVLIPCLASRENRIEIYNYIKLRDKESIIKTFETISKWEK